MVMPGDEVDVTATLIEKIAMEDGMRFAIREGGRTVGAGLVTEITSSKPQGRGGRSTGCALPFTVVVDTVVSV